jgi:hypothetical protein
MVRSLVAFLSGILFLLAGCAGLSWPAGLHRLILRCYRGNSWMDRLPSVDWMKSHEQKHIRQLRLMSLLLVPMGLIFLYVAFFVR